MVATTLKSDGYIARSVQLMEDVMFIIRCLRYRSARGHLKPQDGVYSGTYL